MDKKTLLIILSILLFITLITILAYYLFPKKSTYPSRASDQRYFFPSLSQSGKELFYLESKDQVLDKFSLETNKILDTYPIDVPFVENIIWNNNKDKAILETLNKITGQKEIYTYDFNKKSLASLNQDTQKTNWLSEAKIIYIFNNSGNYSLNQSEPDGTNWQKLVDLDKEFTGLKVSPDGKKVALFPQLTIYDIAINKLSPTQISSASDIQWSPDSQQIAIFASDKTEIYNITQNQAKTLKEKTDSNKFIWLSNEEAIISKSGKYGDEIYKLNITTQKTKTIFKSTKKQPVEVESFLLSPDAKKLYLVNKKDYYLYEITLEK